MRIQWFLSLLATVLAVVAAAGPAAAQDDVGAPATGEAAAAPAMRAVPVEGQVELDGLLDEAVWQGAPAITGFRQFEPQEGAPASHRTEVRVLYGETSLYIGATLFDDDPEAIERALGRRDDYNRADWFLVSIDAYYDRRTAYAFGVNAAGVQFDALVEEQGGGGGGPGGPGGGGGGPRGMDSSWDAVWYSDVAVGAGGWTVELRIPYSMLRFSEAERQTWGIHFRRDIPRLGEQSEWPLVPRTERSNLVARYGQLTGITGIEPRRNVQVTPYTVSRMSVQESDELPGEGVRDGSFDVGGDLKIGLGPNVVLDATVNPDFGQVEADPAVLNLTAFETRFEERRPFFVEGIQIYQFDVGPGELLYTRRIGADSPIIGATKLSGRTARGLSFGVLGATSGDDFSPERHYGVVRGSQQFGEVSSIGGIATAFEGPVFGDGRRQAFTGGADWDLRFADNRYGVEGFAALTHRLLPGLDPQTGAAGKVWLRRRQGAWTGFAGVDVFSDTFNPNELGQLRENNFVATLVSVDHEVLGGRDFGPFQRASLQSMFIQQFAYTDGLNLGQRFSVDGRATLRSFQEIDFDVNVENFLGGYDLYETRGLGPWARPVGVQFRSGFETDQRRAWRIEPQVEFGFDAEGGATYGLGVRGEWNVGTRFSLSGDLEGEFEQSVLAWSSNETFLLSGDDWLVGREAGAPDLPAGEFVAFDDGGALDALLAGVTPYAAGRYFVPVFGARDTRSVDMTLRGTVTFTPDLSLQLYGQFFVAGGRYEDFRIMQGRDDLARFDAFPKQDDFAFSSLQTNAVLRWEYRPGSQVYLVWTHGRRADDVLDPLAPGGPSPYARRLDRRIGDTFTIFPENVFLVKLNYTFLR